MGNATLHLAFHTISRTLLANTAFASYAMYRALVADTAFAGYAIFRALLLCQLRMSRAFVADTAFVGYTMSRAIRYDDTIPLLPATQCLKLRLLATQ